MSHTEPDELYTLRAQLWLGHFQMAVDEAKSVTRRPMSPALKAEREEFLYRAYINLGQYDKVTSTETPALQALVLQAQYLAAAGNEAMQESMVDQIKQLVASSPTPSVQLTAAHVLLAAGHVKEALVAVHLGSTLEHVALLLQIYLRLDRLDLAKQQLNQLKNADEDAILTQLGSVYIALAEGSTMAADALHALGMLSEQYGPSPLLLNLTACALLQQGDAAGAEQKLQECLRDHAELSMPDTLINMVACLVQQNKSADQYVSDMKQQYPSHSFCAGLDRVTAAFDREAIKYKV